MGLRWAGHITRMQEGRSFFFKILIDTPTGKRPLRRTILEWIFKKCVKTRNWFYSALDRDY